MRYSLALALIAGLSLQSGSQFPSKAAPVPPQAPALDQRGTERAPFVIRLDSTQRREDASDRDKQGKGKAAADAALVRYTKYLAGVAFLQLIVFGFQGWKLRDTVIAMGRQEKLVNDSVTEMRRAAEATERTAGAAIESARVAGETVGVMTEQLAAMKGQESRLGETIEQMRDTEERQLRAYVFVERVKPPERDAPRVFYTLAVKNSGQTPAYDVIVRANTAFARAQLTAPLVDPTIPRTTASKFILPARATHYLRVEPLQISPEQIAAFDAGTHSIYIFGTIRYRDAFKKKRWSDFRYAVPKTFGEPESCEEGNEADQNVENGLGQDGYVGNEPLGTQRETGEIKNITISVGLFQKSIETAFGMVLTAWNPRSPRSITLLVNPAVDEYKERDVDTPWSRSP